MFNSGAKVLTATWADKLDQIMMLFYLMKYDNNDMITERYLVIPVSFLKSRR